MAIAQGEQFCVVASARPADGFDPHRLIAASVRADLRRKVRKLLAMYGYPPDLSEDATQLVLKQAELSTERPRNARAAVVRLRFPFHRRFAWRPYATTNAA